jgi:uncharacterized protein (UPF0332 family)
VDRKARENLAAAQLLLDQVEPCPNAATSRAYYAVYHALWASLEESGEQAPEVRPGIRYYPHTPSQLNESITEVAERCSLLSADEATDVEVLRDFRVKADYEVDDVVVEEAQTCLKTARAIVDRLIETEGA